PERRPPQRSARPRAEPAVRDALQHGDAVERPAAPAGGQRAGLSHGRACQAARKALSERPRRRTLRVKPALVAPVAQLDRAPDYESGGQRFESFRARHLRTKLGTPAAVAPLPITSRSRTVFRPWMRISAS